MTPSPTSSRNDVEKHLDDLINIQVNEPTSKTDGYMAGLANGLLLAKSLFGHEYNPISFKDEKKQELKADLALCKDKMNLVAKAAKEVERMGTTNALQDLLNVISQGEV